MTIYAFGVMTSCFPGGQ